MDGPHIVALFLIPPIEGATAWVGVWIHFRLLNRDAPLSSYQKRLGKYLSCFVVGLGYMVFLTALFGWRREVWWLLAAGWTLVVWTLYRRKTKTIQHPAALWGRGPRQKARRNDGVGAKTFRPLAMLLKLEE